MQKCDCECHFGGAVNCPSCKKNHDDSHKCKFC